jgi:hypothetical protein
MGRKDRKRAPGDILGLGDTPPQTSGNDVVGRAREDEAHRRRHRMSEGADELTPEPSAPHRSSGATGIDMGAGGEGTDVE